MTTLLQCQTAELAALHDATDDDSILTAIHDLSATAHVDALREVLRAMSDEALTATARRYVVYLRTVYGVMRLPGFILRNWAALMEREPWEGES
jgi:hypothetical protein